MALVAVKCAVRGAKARMNGRGNREADHCSARSVLPLSLSACTALALSASEKPCAARDGRRKHDFD